MATTPPPPPPRTKTLIIGAGFAGLTAAIECTRHNHAVTVLEAAPALKPLGDIISFGHNAGRIFQRWPGVEAALDPICHDSRALVFNRWDGAHLVTQVWDEDEDERKGKKFSGHRGEMHGVVWEHARGLGVDVRLGRRVVGYFEDEREAGVVVEGGERFVGDVVLAADGVRSTARTIVLGYEDKPKASGYAIWRAWFSSEGLARDPLTRHLVEDGDTHTGWLGMFPEDVGAFLFLLR